MSRRVRDLREMPALARKQSSDLFIRFHSLGPLTAPLIRNKL